MIKLIPLSSRKFVNFFSSSSSAEAKDLAVVQDRLCEKPLNATLVQSSHHEKVLLTVPEFALRAFVKRLNITWQPAPQITQALAHRWHGRQGIRMRVHGFLASDRRRGNDRQKTGQQRYAVWLHHSVERFVRLPP